eukprot:TRINITY_DN209_c0_g1_i10.p1 TRINITY_DN209_c0_g1~~TRINITY_DN209_c0_g1_i10.p1  ORF type:complete len:278 (+),score=13.18 TRINITY_DN209_c0_g1_i10:1167-2000(+)
MTTLAHTLSVWIQAAAGEVILGGDLNVRANKWIAPAVYALPGLRELVGTAATFRKHHTTKQGQRLILTSPDKVFVSNPSRLFTHPVTRAWGTWSDHAAVVVPYGKPVLNPVPPMIKKRPDSFTASPTLAPPREHTPTEQPRRHATTKLRRLNDALSQRMDKRHRAVQDGDTAEKTRLNAEIRNIRDKINTLESWNKEDPVRPVKVNFTAPKLDEEAGNRVLSELQNKLDAVPLDAGPTMADAPVHDPDPPQCHPDAVDVTAAEVRMAVKRLQRRPKT